MYSRKSFGKPFPFEGNWNLLRKTILRISFRSVRKAFPVWRELKQVLFPPISSSEVRSESLSRLKGIETRMWFFRGHRDRLVRKAFPVWRELKHMLWCYCNVERFKVRKAFPVWRELKLDGAFPSAWRNGSFGKPFPFEGNWNSVFLRYNSFRKIPFGKPFPFEGNWNVIASSVLAHATLFGKPFPFEGNWNLRSAFHWTANLYPFGKPFPFEGNWNYLFRREREYPLVELSAVFMLN